MQAARNPDPSFWAGKRVLLTGHTGFKGSWLALWLRRLGASVVGIGLPPITTPSLFGLATIDALVDNRIGASGVIGLEIAASVKRMRAEPSAVDGRVPEVYEAERMDDDARF